MKPWLLDEFQMPLNLWILKVSEYELHLNTVIWSWNLNKRIYMRPTYMKKAAMQLKAIPGI